MEVYGTKPKRFTKEWWEYFWDYYKIHTIATLIVIIFILTTISECMHRPNYDLQIDFISENQISAESINALTAMIEENIDDITENGETDAYVTYLNMGEHSDPQYEQAMFSKFSIEMGYTESYVFLMSSDYADKISEGGILEEASNWTSLPSYNGYCVSLEDCENLRKIGIDTSDLYVGVLKIREHGKASEYEKNRKNQENGIKFAQFLISKR